MFAITSSGTGFDEEAALLGAGREFALMKTASGKVGVSIMLGKVNVVKEGIQHTFENVCVCVTYCDVCYVIMVLQINQSIVCSPNYCA